MPEKLGYLRIYVSYSGPKHLFYVCIKQTPSENNRFVCVKTEKYVYIL